MKSAPLFSICLIARNEALTLPRLINSLKEFQSRGGKVTLLDTGSTDDTPNIARSLGCDVHEVGSRFLITINTKEATQINSKFVETGEEKIVNAGDTQFDYTSARNYAATLAPTDFILTPDCDEIYTVFDIDAINDAVASGASQLEYQFVFSHSADGKPELQFLHGKAYDKTKMQWRGIIHEVLVPTNEEHTRVYLPENIIKLEHFQNPSTDRSHYLRGLAIDVYKDPKNDRNSHYFGRELFARGRYKSAINELRRHTYFKNAYFAEQVQSMIYIGDCYGHLNQPEKQVEWYNKAIFNMDTRREPYIKMAEFYLHNNKFMAAASYAAAALVIPWNHEFYANNKAHYRDVPHRIMYRASGFIGNIEDAKKHLLKCLEYEPNSYEYLRDYRYYFAIPKISVIIPHISGTRQEGLDRVIKSINDQNYLENHIEIIIEESEGTVPEKVNRALSRCSGDYIVYAANDVEFHYNDFIRAYITSIERSVAMVVFDTGVRNDSGYICEHFMIAKGYIKNLDDGQLFHESFHHAGCDDYLYKQMARVGQVVIDENTHTKHYHFSRVEGVPMDDVYEKGWSKVESDRENLKEKLKQMEFPW